MHRAVLLLHLVLTATAWAATPITTRPLAEVLIDPERSAPATVESLNDAELSAKITARIDRIPVRVGDEVAAGVAVNSAIVLILGTNDRLAVGMPLLHTTLYAARRRLVPILIT